MKDIESGKLTKLASIADQYNQILEDSIGDDAGAGIDTLSLTYDPKRDTLAIDIESLNDTAEYVVKILTGEEDVHDDFSSVDDYEDFIRDHLPDAAMPSIINLFKQNLEEIKEALGDDELELDDIDSSFVLDNVNELVQMGLLDGLESALDRLNSDAVRIGAESEMVDALKSAIDEALSVLGLSGIDYNLFELIQEDKFFVPVKTEQLRTMFSTVVNDVMNGADFDELIKVEEPRYGFSGFDEDPIREYWRDSFSDNEIEVIEISKEEEAA